MAKTKTKSKARSTGSEPVRIGVIGGSGLYTMPGLANAREVRIKTPFGDPSDALVVGQLEGKRVAFSGTPRARAPISTDGNKLSRQHPRHETTRCRANRLGQRRRFASGGFETTRFLDSRPVLRSHPPPRIDFFRRWRGPRTLVSRNPCVHNSPGCSARPATAPKYESIAAAPISAWRARNFPRSPKPMFTANYALK